MSIILGLIVGSIMGWFTSIIIGHNTPGEIIRNIIIACVGVWLSGLLLGNWSTVHLL